jgi:broad specificity phosphatase PhoE
VTTINGTPLRLFVFARHSESVANAGRVLNADPSRPAALTERGRAQARALGAQLANLPVDLAVCSRLPRTRETVSIALDGRPVPVLIEPGFDEIQAGDLDGAPIRDYWDWLGQHTASDRLPHGESLDDALLRYSGALRWLLTRVGAVILVVTHELALRHIAAAAAPSGSPPGPGTDFPNAVPYLFDENAVRRAAAGLAALADTSAPTARLRSTANSAIQLVARNPGRHAADIDQAALQHTREHR